MAIDRSRLPSVGPAPPFVFPAARRTRLTNGLDVTTVEHRKMPVVSSVLLLRCGAASDPVDQAGLASLTAALLDEGTRNLTGLEVYERFGRLGAQFDVDAGMDATVVRLTTLAGVAGEGLSLLAELVIEPRFDHEAFDRLRALRLDRLAQLREVAPALADRAFARVLYGRRSYGHLPSGTEGEVRSLTRNDVVAFHARGYRPALAALIVVGDGTHEALVGMAEAAFGGWTDAPVPSAPEPAVEHSEVASELPRLVVVDRPGAAQSEIRIGHVAVSRDTPDYFPLLVLNMAFGGQFTSRLNLNLREDKGYTYGVCSVFEFRRRPGPFMVQTSVETAATSASVREVLDEIRAVRDGRPVTRLELARATSGLTRGYPRGFETAEQIARGLAQVALHGLPDDHFSQFGHRVEAVNEADVARVAREHLDPGRLSTVIVGDRAEVADSLAEVGLGSPTEVDLP